MSFTNPVFGVIPRQSVSGMEAMFIKMWDPPNESPITPDLLVPTNPVPEVMAAAGFQNAPSTPHTVVRALMHGRTIQAWDGKNLQFFLFQDADNPATGGGNFPAATIRVPQGAIFHANTQGAGPPPHTIHWHGIEPTPINDGVGHCSMEIGQYTYQFQPNHIGTYFYHCHRNTVQHFEFGLWGGLLIVPMDAYFATQQNPAIPIGACRDGRFRIQADLTRVLLPDGSTEDWSARFPGFNSNLITAPDPLRQFLTDPHAMTVPYDVGALWAFDDRDSAWSDLAPDARITYPQQGPNPGIDDNFHGNAGGDSSPANFFAFNDFNADYWFVTGVSVPGPRLGTGTIPAGIVIPPALDSGQSGTQVSINARVGQTILIQVINAAYNTSEVTMPVDVLIIGADGRGLGITPFRQYSQPFVLPANTPIRLSVARRADIICKATSPINDFATIDFFDTRSEDPFSPGNRLFTALIPFNITATSSGAFTVSGSVFNSLSGAAIPGVTVILTGEGVYQPAVTDAAGNYSFTGLANDRYTVIPFLSGLTFSPREIQVTVNGANETGRFFRGIGS